MNYKLKKITSIDGLVQDSEYVKIVLEDDIIVFFHEQVCCEQVYLEDFNITGNNDGALLYDIDVKTKEGEHDYGTETYTFYSIKTSKGIIDLRFHGESNGYYSESVYVKSIKETESMYQIFPYITVEEFKQYYLGKTDFGYYNAVSLLDGCYNIKDGVFE